MPRTEPPLFAGLPYRRLSPAQRAALAARLAGVRARPFLVLDCFSGIGGFALAYQAVGWQTAAFCEIDPFCRRVLAHHWPETPCYDDIRELSADRLRDDGIGRVDALVGGPPCQPTSVAGQRGGAADPRWLWPEFLRLVQTLRPRWVVAENPPGILSLDAGRAFRGILTALAEGGYLAGWATYGACDVGAPQARERMFLVAHPSGDVPQRHGGPGLLAGAPGAAEGGVSERQRDGDAAGRGGAALADAAGEGRRRTGRLDIGLAALRAQGGECVEPEPGRSGAALPDADREPLGWAAIARQERGDGGAQPGMGDAAPRLSRWLARWPARPGAAQEAWEAPRTVTERIPERADKLRALGNAVVPAQAAPIFAAIAAYERAEASA